MLYMPLGLSRVWKVPKVSNLPTSPHDICTVYGTMLCGRQQSVFLLEGIYKHFIHTSEGFEVFAFS
jgi:hypothetical protein